MKRFSLLVLMVIFLITILSTPAFAADITGERTLNTTSVRAGDSFRVTLNITVLDGLLYAPGIDEDLPSGWTITEVQNDGLVYQAANTQWVLVSDMEPGTKTIIYDVLVPETAETGTYSISGKISAKEWDDGGIITRENTITGDTNVTVGLAGIHIYSGDDFKSILTNAPSGSTIYWHAGEYGSSTTKTTVEISAPLYIIGDSPDSVVLRNVGITVLDSSDNCTIEKLQFTGSKGLSINSKNYNSEFLTVRDCLFNNVLGSLMVKDSTTVENCTIKDSRFSIQIETGKGGGLVKNNTFDNDYYKYIMAITDVNNVTCVGNNYLNCNVALSIFNLIGTNDEINIYGNNFINCSSYAYYLGNDPGVSWSSPSELSYTYDGKDHVSVLGNYYDTYEGADADGNGVGDTSYTVGSGTDSAPLMSPFENYGNITEVAPQSPVAGFTADPVSGSVPLSVNFTDQSTGNPTSWSWDFDNDGSVDSTDQNPVYTYDTTGNYTVSLTVKNSVGSNSTVKTDYITVSKSSTPSEPVADFTADITNGTAPLTVDFTDLSTDSTSWFWDFDNDGTVDSTEQSPSHTYEKAGTYTVNLTVENSAGTDSEVKTDYIVVSSQETPDTTNPVIESVVLFPANTTAGSTINLSVNATDDVEVSEVIAGDVPLTKTDGIWQGSITAPSSVGTYSLAINATDTAGNIAETSASYSVVKLSGGVSVSVSPRSNSVKAGNTVSLNIKVKNTQNIDDSLKLSLSVSELPASYRADLSWFNWTDTVVTLKAGEQVVIPVEVTVPSGISTGYKLFRATVNSETSSITGFDTGYLIIS